MANIIAKPAKSTAKEVAPLKSMAASKRWISNQFYKSLNRHMETDEDGDVITFAQAMVDGVVEMATDKERDDYVRLAATKFIVEHMEGKAGTMQDETHEEMPQIVINVKNMNMSNIQNTVNQISSPKPENDIISEMEAEYQEIGEEDGEHN